MRARPLIPLVLPLAACGTQRPLCPTDLTRKVTFGFEQNGKQS